MPKETRRVLDYKYLRQSLIDEDSITPQLMKHKRQKLMTRNFLLVTVMKMSQRVLPQLMMEFTFS